MYSSNEVFLGQKNSVARFDLKSKTAIWSKELKGYPYIITTYGDKILVQGTNLWGTKYFHCLLDALTGEEVWSTKDIKCYITPQYHKGDIYFFNHKGEVCKLCGKTGKLLFETKFKKWHDSNTYLLTITQEKIYIISRKRSFIVGKATGECEEVPELEKFSKENISAAYGNGIDQIALMSVIAAAAASGDGGAGAVYGGGDAGGGGGDG